MPSRPASVAGYVQQMIETLDKSTSHLQKIEKLKFGGGDDTTGVVDMYDFVKHVRKNVQRSYDSGHKKFGSAFSTGDNECQIQLIEVLLALKNIAEALSEFLTDDAVVDFESLKFEVHDYGNDAVRYLGDLVERLEPPARTRHTSSNASRTNSIPFTSPDLQRTGSGDARSSNHPIVPAKRGQPERLSSYGSESLDARASIAETSASESLGDRSDAGSYVVDRGRNKLDGSRPASNFIPQDIPSNSWSGSVHQYPDVLISRQFERIELEDSSSHLIAEQRRPFLTDADMSQSPVSAERSKIEGNVGYPYDRFSVDQSSLASFPIRETNQLDQYRIRQMSAPISQQNLSTYHQPTRGYSNDVWINEEPAPYHRPSTPVQIAMDQDRQTTAGYGNVLMEPVEMPASPPIYTPVETKPTLPPQPRLPSGRFIKPGSIMQKIPMTCPSEDNYDPLCKGAFYLFSGLTKQAFEIYYRPMGSRALVPYWRCKKCYFEGPVQDNPLPPDKKGRHRSPERVFDTTIRQCDAITTAIAGPDGVGQEGKGGIWFRWAFLAKCHVHTKSAAEVDEVGRTIGMKGAFACIFCMAEGTGKGWVSEVLDVSTTTNSASRFLGLNKRKSISSAGRRRSVAIIPTFGSVSLFMDHLQMHRAEENWPGEFMIERMKCVVGRVANRSEDFEVNFLPL